MEENKEDKTKADCYKLIKLTVSRDFSHTFFAKLTHLDQNLNFHTVFSFF